jgi:hypothetical protein
MHVQRLYVLEGLVLQKKPAISRMLIYEDCFVHNQVKVFLLPNLHCLCGALLPSLDDDARRPWRTARIQDPRRRWLVLERVESPAVSGYQLQ